MYSKILVFVTVILVCQLGASYAQSGFNMTYSFTAFDNTTMQGFMLNGDAATINSNTAAWNNVRKGRLYLCRNSTNVAGSAFLNCKSFLIEQKGLTVPLHPRISGVFLYELFKGISVLKEQC